MNEQTTPPSLVIVGNGMVAGRLLDELLGREGQHYRITVIGAEPHGCYNRIMLSSVLAKDASVESIVQKDRDWYDAHGVELKAGALVEGINREQKYVEIVHGERVFYDELVIATGSNAARIPAKNLNLEHIFTFRTLADTHAMMNIAASSQKALVVGGGLLGLEAAYGLAKSGIAVTLVHRSGWLLNRQLDVHAANMLKRVMADMGIQFRLSDEVTRFGGEKRVESAQLNSGEEIKIDLAIIATGIRPNAQLGLNHGLAGERAIQVDDYMRSSAEHISALGECIEHNGQTFGLVDPLWRQAETLAARLVESKLVPFKNSAIATKLKVSGVQVFSAGDVESKPEFRSLVVRDERNNIYRKLLLKNNRIKGIVLFGDVSSGQYYFELMQAEKDVSELLPTLLLGDTFLPESSSDTIAA